MKDVCREFGSALARELHTAPSSRNLTAQRANLLFKWHALRAARRKSRRLLLSAGFAIALSAAGVLLLWQADSTVPTITWEGQPLGESTSLVTGERSGLLRFANGSSIELEANTTAVLGRHDAEHTEVALQRGRLQADVQRAPGSRWSVAAGPYRIQVVGTQFIVDWRPSRGTFSVAVTRGEVRVFGGDLPKAGVAIPAGERLERHVLEERPAMTEGVLEPPLAAEQPELAVPPAPAPVVATSTPPTNNGPPAARAGWRKLASQGQYAEALHVAEELGFDQLLRTASASDLLLLGNAARFANQPARARQAYTTLRTRFATDPGARLAAFYLARLAADAEGRPTQAIHWLRIFLRESPDGDLAASARARLMDTLASQGDRKGAAEVARDYLRYHPGGPHSDVARSLR